MSLLQLLENYLKICISLTPHLQGKCLLRISGTKTIQPNSVIEDLFSFSCSHPNLPNNKSGTYGSLTLSSGAYLRALGKRDQFISALSIPGIRMVSNKCAINI